MESRLNSRLIKTSILFAESDLPIAEKIARGLLEKGVKIYSDNPQLKGAAETWGVHKFELIDETFAEDIQYYIVLVSKNFHREKWMPIYKYKLLETAIRRKNIILPVIIGDVKEIPGITPLIGHIRIEPTDFQIVIDTFLKKVSLLEASEFSDIKPYERIQTILKIYNPKLIWEEIDKYIDKTERIGFELYEATDPLIETSKQYFLFLNAGINSNKTYEFIREEHAHIFHNKNLIILFPKEKEQARPEKRKNNLRELFNPTKIFYLDEFIWEHCTNEEFRKDIPKFSIENFVDPHIKEDHRTALIYLSDWLQKEKAPILVIKGTGGIGKTTVVKKFSNFVHENIPNTKVLFIDSTEIIKHLIKNAEFLDHPLELYNIYQAYDEVTGSARNISHTLNQDLFRANIDNGNIIFIIDGLDEIISKLGNLFDINIFLASIYDYSSEVGNGKVILTCRNYFWDRSNPRIPIESIEQLPFDKELTRKYFEKNFPNMEKAVRKGLQIAKNLMKDKTQEEFIPFVLDVVTYMIRDEIDSTRFEDPTFDSQLLNIGIRNDYILYKICYRENEKLGQSLDVDSQIRFFVTLAIYYNSQVKLEKFASVFNKAFDISIGDLSIESMKAHPVLYIKDDFITFRYDFFEEHFKNILLGQLLQQKIQLNYSLIEILTTYTRFNSSFIEDSCTRIGHLDETTKLSLIQIIENIRSYNLGNMSVSARFLKEKAMSSIFTIALKTLQKTSSLSIENTTSLMKDFFQSEGMILNMSLQGLNIINSDKIIFDFSSLRFKNCFFSDYDYFFECRFDKDTFFEHCTFNSLYLREGIKTTASESNFDFSSCRMDESIENVLRKTSLAFNDLKQNVISDLKAFLKMFYVRGNMQSKTVAFLKSKYKRRVIPFEDLLSQLIEKQLLVPYGYGGEGENRRWDVAVGYKGSLIKFCLEGTMSVMIKETINLLLEKNR